MQLTVEISEQLAKQIESAHLSLAEVIQRGLGQPISSESALAQEVIEFLGRGPKAGEIIDFKPSDAAVERATSLIEKNREGAMTPEERAEMEEVSSWNRFFSLIKAKARLNLRAAV